MQIGIIGLGKMGYNLALNLKDNGQDVIAYNRSSEKTDDIVKEGVKGAYSFKELVDHFNGRRVIWLMVPEGKPVDDMIEQLVPLLNPHDIIIDGGNSNYKDTLHRYQILKEIGIDFADAGTSGGISGARYGACSMIGAEEEVFAFIEPVFASICVENGYYHCGAVGSGHYVKMVHNGVEYGMMQAIGEGFDILRASEFELDLEKVAKVWNHGSVIRSWLIELAEEAFRDSPELTDIRDIVHSSGEGLWTVEEALRLQVPAQVITDALYVRYASERNESFSNKVVAALRNGFGGHKVEKK